MSSTLLPFLYQTRTLRLAFRGPVSSHLVRFAHSSHSSRRPKKDNAIPFEWDPEVHDEPEQVSTITPSEAQIFKGIFDEIAQGRMPQSKKRPTALQDGAVKLADSSTTDGAEGNSGSGNQSIARSIVEQARITEFREKFLRRYPTSLRDAAHVALGLYESEPENPDSAQSRMIELDEGDQERWTERAKYDRARAEELERVETLMKSCKTDNELWAIMETEVFSLPAKLGILQTSKKTSKLGEKTTRGKPRKATESRQDTSADGDQALALALEELQLEEETATQDGAENAKKAMNVHGPLYSQFIDTALELFNTAFARPSPYAFQILPRVKALGLPSYVLGVSTPFYYKLASLHWEQFGDANSALDVLHEMSSAGLYADAGVKSLLSKMQDHLHSCSWGAQGPFVMAMMESPPYDGALTQRLEDMEQIVRQSLYESATDYAA